MGLQYLKCPSSALFTLGILQIVGYLSKRKLLVDDVFGDFFIDPDTKDGWNKIQRVIEPHSLSKLMLTGSTPSKPVRQGDGQFGPFMIQKQHANLCSMYNKANELGIIKDPDEEYLRMWRNFADFPFQNQEATLRWNAILAAYEVIHEIEATTQLVIEAIKPMYYTMKLYDKTPMEVQYFAGDMMNGNLQLPDSLCVVPWSTIDQFKTGDLNNPGIIDVMFELQFEELWYIPVPVVSFGSATESFPLSDPSVKYVLSSNNDCFHKSANFVPDPPPVPPPIFDPSAVITPDTYQANLWACSITAGDPMDTGTVNIFYRRLIVNFI